MMGERQEEEDGVLYMSLAAAVEERMRQIEGGGPSE